MVFWGDVYAASQLALPIPPEDEEPVGEVLTSGPEAAHAELEVLQEEIIGGATRDLGRAAPPPDFVEAIANPAEPGTSHVRAGFIDETPSWF
jgi:hypothetical protein